MTENEFLKYVDDLISWIDARRNQPLILSDLGADAAVKALNKYKQYRAIGTVEECREAREKQRAKKPNHFYKKYGKHQWKRKDDGEIDEDAWDSDTHSGVICEVCGECVCTMCNPYYDELDDCEEEYWICPNCAKKIYCKDEYCQCGQRLDWSDIP